MRAVNINRITVEFKVEKASSMKELFKHINRITVEFKEDTRYTPGSYALRY